MLSAQGDSLGMTTLKQGYVNVVLASPTVECAKRGLTTMQCTIAGTATITWKDGTTDIAAPFVVGQQNSIERDSITSIDVLTGSFNFGTD